MESTSLLCRYCEILIAYNLFALIQNYWGTLPKEIKPCNQFAGQAPESDEEIHQFCTMKFGTNFPQFKKSDVNGETANPLFERLATAFPFQGFGKGIKALALDKFAKANNKKFGNKAYIMWNFTKFLVDRQGNVVARFEPTADMAEVETAIKNLLA